MHVSFSLDHNSLSEQFTVSSQLIALLSFYCAIKHFNFFFYLLSIAKSVPSIAYIKMKPQ
jgi:hypothetical protein